MVVPGDLRRCRGDRGPSPVSPRHFLALAGAEGLPGKTLDQAALERLKTYRWPGNVRELENLVRRLTALYAQEVIGGDVIESELAEAMLPGEPAAAPANEGLGAAVERHCQEY